MAKAAYMFDPHMLQTNNLEYASDATVLFQRLSVCLTSLVLIGAMLRATHISRCSAKGLAAFALVVCNAGLIMVDNIHFQYNSILMGACCDRQQGSVGSALQYRAATSKAVSTADSND
jgi:alpha-1,3-glucosyltransferase